ncbi:MAG: hypothetical protein A2607_02010 [Candidatus Vogelbacteria bacterium RIFOXYD1_FULL_42_15]|uniref:Phosphoglycerate mutase (2,3-diphosphoglycerate-dependent) n=1 Tax=Candidatus Vogelbacteria bacterium RIFOXYD1_FULL_42_15 TaxID=1802437 RepID=A0A1G2QIT2_9BACT|nr:MAG: hypothetical protein A2607_02010 [Candidatus Vogelbacteria bacterium RIFOXYD1_FULL_42_15]
MWPKQIIVVRHAESEGNIRQMDDNSSAQVPNHQFSLTKNGEAQALVTGEYLRKNSEFFGFDVAFTSTFWRAQQTLHLMCPKIVPRIDARLDEFWRGIWHTMSKEEVEKLYPAEAKIKEREGWYHYRAFGGQNGQDVDLMIYSFLADLREFWSGKRVLIVGHGTWMIFFWRIMCRRSIAEAEKRYQEKKFRNASITVFEQKDDGMKLTIDDFLPKNIDSGQATTDEINKAINDLANFTKTVRWWGLLGKLGQSKERLKIYSYDDACDMHEALYLSGEGFINEHLRPVGNLAEVVEGFMVNVFYGAETNEWNSQQHRRPSQLIPWLESLCLSRGL